MWLHSDSLGRNEVSVEHDGGRVWHRNPGSVRSQGLILKQPQSLSPWLLHARGNLQYDENMQKQQLEMYGHSSTCHINFQGLIHVGSWVWSKLPVPVHRGILAHSQAGAVTGMSTACPRDHFHVIICFWTRKELPTSPSDIWEAWRQRRPATVATDVATSIDPLHFDGKDDGFFLFVAADPKALLLAARGVA